MTTKDVILNYWRSWQKPDFVEFRSYLADTIDMGGRPVSADMFTEMCAKGSRWQGVELLASVFSDDGGALFYTGTNTANGAAMKVTEFLQVRDGKIVALRGVALTNGTEMGF